MVTVAYLANQYPSEVEPYVGDEIVELRKRGVRVISGSVRTACGKTELPDVVVQRAGAGVLVHGLWLLASRWGLVSPLVVRIFKGREPVGRRFRALFHTVLGACYAAQLQGHKVDHLHVHHGYFGSWIGMTAARLLNVGFSLTLHGSDLLVNGQYLDTKLEWCDFCITISEYNRNYILERFPEVDAGKIVVSRLGVDIPKRVSEAQPAASNCSLNIAAVGRLHPVKDHAFLVRVCAELLARGVPFVCRIAGEGPERHNLEWLIKKCGLAEHVSLLGHIARQDLARIYQQSDVVILTSRSEGIPLVLMEAMARGKIVLAPAITGIPELVRVGETGFLYKAGSIEDCVVQLQFIESLLRAERSSALSEQCSSEDAGLLERMRERAVTQVEQNFSRTKNLETLGNLFLQRMARGEQATDANLILQQI